MHNTTPENKNIAELESEKLRLEHAVELQSKFLMGLGHELRTPLNVILGFAQLLKQFDSDNLTKEQRENVDEIIQSANQIVEVSKETLAWSKVAMDTHQSTLSSVRLSDALSEVCHLLYAETQLKQLKLLIKLNEQVVSIKKLSSIPTLVIVDKLILQQALLTVLTMLIKHMPEQGVISINITTQMPTQNTVQLTIHTSKTLYTSQEREQLSSVTRLTYDKEKSVDARLIELSLMNTKQLLKSVNGKLKVQQNKNKEDLFIIELVCPDLEGKQKGELTDTAEPLVDVLYIEDNPAAIRLVKQLLINIGEFSFHSASSATMGLEMATTLKPQLILIDINLPDFTGIELFKSLKNIANLENTKFIAISGDVEESAVNRALNQGFDDYITKPISIDDFSNKIKLFC